MKFWSKYLYRLSKNCILSSGTFYFEPPCTAAAATTEATATTTAAAATHETNYCYFRFLFIDPFFPRITSRGWNRSLEVDFYERLEHNIIQAGWGCPSCQPTNSSKQLKKTQQTFPPHTWRHQYKAIPQAKNHSYHIRQQIPHSVVLYQKSDWQHTLHLSHK